LAAAVVVTAGLWTFNRVTDRKIMNEQDQEEQEEKKQIEKLKSELPLSILKRYNLNRK